MKKFDKEQPRESAALGKELEPLDPVRRVTDLSATHPLPLFSAQASRAQGSRSGLPYLEFMSQGILSLVMFLGLSMFVGLVRTGWIEPVLCQ